MQTTKKDLVNDTPITSLYDEVIERKIPHSNHESDLYIPVTPITTALLEKYPIQKTISSTFIHTKEKTRWYDVSFAFLPYWSKPIFKKN
jgi:hypothetical protein